jgi:hypothetical protein
MRIARATLVLVLLLLTQCNASGERKVFSSRTSPDGAMVAENVIVDDSDGGSGHLVVRDRRSQKEYDQRLSEPAPDIFMRWIDDSELELWRDAAGGEIGKFDRLGDVRIVRKSYEFPHNSADTYPRSGPHAEAIAVPASKVLGIFKQRPTQHGKDCLLSIETAPDVSHDVATMEITVGVNANTKANRPSAGVSTRFSLGNRMQPSRQTMLTSATMSNIPSYNRLPEGAEGTMVRGQFLEQNAVALIEHLEQPAIEIAYSRDFFEEVRKYDLPLAGIANTLSEFHACIGNADLLWRDHMTRGDRPD